MNDFFNFETMVEQLVDRVVSNVNIHDLHGAWISNGMEVTEWVLDQPTECGKTLRDNLYDLQCLGHALNAAPDFAFMPIVYNTAYATLQDSNEVTL